MVFPTSDSRPQKRSRDNETTQPAKKLKRSSEEFDGASPEAVTAPPPVKPTDHLKHTKKERKQNRSSRIHSLRKLLARGGLPSTIQQEKERELAALLHDQEKHKTKKETKKVLEKYHYVRFIERQKAEKRLRQLKKQLDNSEGEDVQVLRQKIHEMEVNRNYAIYAPLGEKYLSVFAKGHSSEPAGSQMQSGSKAKPPVWYVVEKLMREGQTQLEALRDGKTRHGAPTIDEDNADVSLGKSTIRSGQNGGTKGQPLDKRKVKTKSMQGSLDKESGRPAVRVEEDDMSDGGFFER